MTYTQVETDTLETICGLLPAAPRDVHVEFDDHVGMWGVWFEGELIGAGQAKSEALSAASAQCRFWSES